METYEGKYIENMIRTAGIKRFRYRVKITLPCPPSINHYHGYTRGAKHKRVVVYVTKAGKRFQREVKQIILANGCPSFGKKKVAIFMIVHLPTRAGDHHNREKPLLDALEEANVFDNDKQVVDLRIVKGHPVQGGRCDVTIWENE
jgi:Holliday junction resolvase RusA-like endonuclease